MNNTSTFLIKQYYALANERKTLKKEVSQLPVGSLQKKKIKNKEYFYRQYRAGATIKTIFVPNNQVDDIERRIIKRRAIEQRLREISDEMDQIIKGLGAGIHEITDFEDYKPVKNVNYKDYTMYMSHLAHEIKRIGKDEFVIEYSHKKETGLRARYLTALLCYLSKEKAPREYRSANLVLDPLTYEMYYTYGKKEILSTRIKNAIPEFLMQGLLITNIQEAVGGTLS